MKSIRLTRAIIFVVALCVMPGAVHAEWWEARTDHFIVITEDTEANARAYAERMERYDGALRTLQNMAPQKSDIGDANRVTIYRFGTTDDIGRLAGSYGVAGFYLPRAGEPTAFSPIRESRETGSLERNTSYDPTRMDAESVLKHEYVHHFMLYNFPASYPGWYTEGFAELYATLELREDGSFHVGNPPQYRGYALFNMLIAPTERFFDGDRAASGFDLYQRYTLGWLLTHYLTFTPGRQGQLPAFLAALGKGEKSLDAARRIFGDLGQLDRELRRYLRTELPGINVKPANYQLPVVAMRRIEGAEAATMMQRIEIAAGLSKKEAPAAIRALEEDSQRYPDSALVWELLGKARFAAEDWAGADAALDRALAIDGNRIEALIYRGCVTSKRAKADPAAAKARRPFLVRAARLDQRTPRPLIEYYYSYRAAGEPIPEAAIIGLEDAFGTAAHDANYRYLLGMQLISEGKGSAAKAVLLPISVALHGIDPKKNKIAEAINLIEAGKTAEAYTLLKTEEEKREKEAEKE
ncbi:MAG: hypothetical protein FJX31_00105 [Alphaproteobacteria bacterium]|nr:hypothetical protein [Alphaproteobacteria bacterium]